MKFKEIIITGLVTLVLTIVGGVIVWYITQTPKTERIEFSVQRSASMQTDKGALSFTFISIKNIGNVVARNVKTVVTTAKNEQIVEKQFKFSSGPVGNITNVESSVSQLSFLMPSLAPEETLSISLLTNGDANDLPTINIRSDESLGMKSTLENDPSNVAKSVRQSISPVVAIFLIFLAALFQGAFLLTRRFRKFAYPATQNNTAFLLLQRKMPDEAQPLLESVIKSKGASSYEFANLALCLAFKNEVERSQNLFRIAEFLSVHKHQKAMVLYNQSILSVHEGRMELAYDQLKEAFKLAPRYISEWCSLNLYFAESNNAQLLALIQSGGKS